VNADGPTYAEEAIEAIADLDRQAQAAISPHQRWIEGVTQRLGRPRTVYAVIAFVAVWIGANLTLHALHRAPFDPPPFSLLQGIVSLAGLLMATLILTTANRIAQIDTQRDKLDLQINLLNERRTGKLIRMLDEQRRDNPELPTHDDPEVRKLSEPNDTLDVVRAIEESTASEDTAPI
jgi:uncharacterized membrane protein